MNEINFKKVVKIMPGKDEFTQEYKAYDLQNTILIGKTGSGISNALNNIVLNLVQENSPKELGIHYLTTADYNIPWFSESRKIPHLGVRLYYSSDTKCGIDLFTEAVIRLIYTAYMNEKNIYSEDMNSIYDDRKHVIILDIDNNTIADRDAFKAIRCLLHYVTKHNTNCKVLLVTQSLNKRLCVLEDLFDLRLLTRTSEELSNDYLGCNLAALEEKQTGFLWVAEKQNPYIKRRLSVPYKPISLYNKLCKYLCNDSFVSEDTFSATWEDTHTDNWLTKLAYFTTCIRDKYESDNEDDIRGECLFYYLKTLDKSELYSNFLMIYREYLACDYAIYDFNNPSNSVMADKDD